MTSIRLILDLITPGLCGGASPAQQAEIRAPSIRGQLRWWFRTLGGFASSKGVPVPDQEAAIFGACAGDAGQASKLQVRVRAVPGSAIHSNVSKNADELGGGMNTPQGYILFPLRQQKRALFEKSLPTLELHLNWRGPTNLADDIRALATVFGNLGSLGFRSRRAMGALAFVPGYPPPMNLAAALARFANPKAIVLCQLATPVTDADSSIRALAGWLKGWRSYGRAPHLNTHGSGFKFAENDHHMGCGQNPQGKAYRAALGLPIIQFYSSTRQTSNWDESWNSQRRKGEGRFASPVLLRPHRDPQGKWHALVIFVDAHKWPEDKPVFLNGQPRQVSLDLYNAMKRDTNLTPFQ